MELVLPKNYVEITEEEMMYLDGGSVARDLVFTAIGGVVASIIGRGVSQSFLGAMISAASGWVANQINAAIVCALLNPGAAIAIGLVTVGTIVGVYYLGRNKKWW